MKTIQTRLSFWTLLRPKASRSFVPYEEIRELTMKLSKTSCVLRRQKMKWTMPALSRISHTLHRHPQSQYRMIQDRGGPEVWARLSQEFLRVLSTLDVV